MATLATTPALTTPALHTTRTGVLRALAPATTWLALQALTVGVLAALSAANGHHANLAAWDGSWYLGIAEHGYSGVDGTMVDAYGRRLAWTPMVFFGGYPLVVHAASWLTLGHVLIAAVAVSVTAGTVAAFGIARLTRHLGGSRRDELVAVCLTATAPMGVVHSMAYPLSLVLAGAVWALVGLLERRWALTTVGALVAGACEPLGWPAVGIVMIAALVAIHRGDGPRWRPLLALFVAPAGAYAYLLYVTLRTGDLFGWFHAQERGWGSRFDGGWSTARFVAHSLIGGRDAYPVITALLCIGSVALLVWTRSRLPWQVWAYGLLVLVLVLGSGGLVVWPKARLLLVAAPLLVPVAVALAGRGRAMWWPLAAAMAFGVWFSAYALTVWPYSI